MIQIDATVGAVGVLALSTAAFVSARHIRRSRRVKQPQVRLPDLPDLSFGLGVAPVEVLPAQRMDAAPAPFLLDEDPVGPFVLPRTLAAEPAAPADSARPVVKVRQVAPAGKARTPRPVAPVVLEAAPKPEAKTEFLSLVETMQWDRALAWLQRHIEEGGDLQALASAAESAAVERLRALPDSELKAALAGYRVLAALVPSNEAYAEKLAQARDALDGRRGALLGRLTRDEDRWEPGTVWFNHPYNPAFDDVRLPIWLYIGRREDGQTWLRLRTNWLGETRISVQGIEALHDRMAETLTDGHYKIDADALGWEWRDEAVTPYQLEVLRSLVAADGVTLRYKGDPYAVEVDLAPEEIRAVAEMIEAYDLMRAEASASLSAPAMAA